VEQKDAGVSAGVGGAQPLGETPGVPERASIGTQREGGLPRVGLRPWHVEGRQNRRWILLDYVDVVVHLFHRVTRDYYRLENLWAEAPREDVTEAQARPVSGREDE
jgi:hypothetical protein